MPEQGGRTRHQNPAGQGGKIRLFQGPAGQGGRSGTRIRQSREQNWAPESSSRAGCKELGSTIRRKESMEGPALSAQDHPSPAAITGSRGVPAAQAPAVLSALSSDSSARLKLSKLFFCELQLFTFSWPGPLSQPLSNQESTGNRSNQSACRRCSPEFLLKLIFS